MNQYTIALAGNPNCGKTTLFNELTSSRERVGNWPGVTVEHLEGSCRFGDSELRVVDLPGIYSFSTHTPDEDAARRYVLNEKPDVVVNIIDARSVERSLYLTAQLLEMRVPVVVALNMMDLAKRRQIRVELDHLAAHIGCPVIPIIAARGQGRDELLKAAVEAAQTHALSSTMVEYDRDVEDALAKLTELVKQVAVDAVVDPRWLAIKLLERDELAHQLAGDAFGDVLAEETERIQKRMGEDIQIVMADGRYGFVHGLALDVVHRENELRKTVSSQIDRFVLSRAFGVPLFLGVMYLVFKITISLSAPLTGLIDQVFSAFFIDGVRSMLASVNAPLWASVLLADGLGGGIQTVATFIPPIFFMFLCLSVLEGSGYMARAAFVMDRTLRLIGLPGKAFIPMLVGFGCNVPGILAARTLEDRRDRTLTVLLNPFMSCGARLPVYVLFASVFFPHNGGAIIFALYLTGVLLAVGSGLLFKNTILKGEASSFVMELPPYHIPTLRGTLFHTWERLKEFILRAGKVIMILVLILSFLWSVGTDGSFGNQESGQSVLSAISRTITPVLEPMGVHEDNWPATLGLVTGVFGKELVVGTLNTFYSKGGTDAATTMLERFDGKVGAYAYLLFILIYAPCVAAIAAVYRETSLKWALFSVSYLTLLAWLFSVMFYQIGTFSAHPASSTAWAAGGAGMLLLFYQGLKIYSRRR